MPTDLTPAACKPLRGMLQSMDLRLSSLMECLSLTGTEQEQQIACERLKRAAELAHALCPESPPLIETTTGHGPWNKLKSQVREHLAEWGKVVEAEQVVLAIKPHRGEVVNRPEDAVWLVRQVANPQIGLTYDYSHFARRGIDLEESLRLMLPYTRFIHVKDWRKRNGREEFALPGESGEIDYVALLKQLQQSGYYGNVCCEISAMVFNQNGYDPVAAARTCYSNLASAFEAAGIPRKSAS